MVATACYYFTVAATPDDDRFLLDRFLAHRRKSELCLGEGTEIVLGEPVVIDRGEGILSASYAGRESNGRQFMAKIALNEGTLAVVYLERVDQDAMPIEDVARPLFGSVVVGPSD
ncbi:hypothetical protein [Acidiphilium sp.]|uniref:hypothetical protein n=1 Tax=Acidiphilium sp. TaxID=527 RepID=UPI00258E0DE7|nr:hypothetical protein [Acidiphilium sp.]